MSKADQYVHPNNCQPFISRGMTVRQWYAGQALPELMRRAVSRPEWSVNDVAQFAFGYADAMLKFEFEEKERQA